MSERLARVARWRMHGSARWLFTIMAFASWWRRRHDQAAAAGAPGNGNNDREEGAVVAPGPAGPFTKIRMTSLPAWGDKDKGEEEGW